MLSLLGATFTCNGCSGNSGTGDGPKRPESLEPGDPIEVIDGKVRFFVDVDNSAPRVKSGLTREDILSSASAVYVNGLRYELESDDSGARYADVMENSDGTYRAAIVMDGGDKWFLNSPTVIKVPSGQVWSDGVSFADAPMYGSYSEATGNRLYMNDIFGVLNLVVKGSGNVVSVKLHCDGSDMSGVFMNSASGLVGADKTNDYVTLNCTNGGADVPMDRSFVMYLAPGDYKDAELVICDSERRVMHIPIDLTINSGELLTEEIRYEADEDVLWYEGFDLCAWGGNIMGGASSFGFAPHAGATDVNSGDSFTGTEEALETVAYNVSGTGFIQPDVWNDINGKTVGAAHRMTESYVTSRNFAGYRYLFRAREFPGMMSVSYGVTSRGILATPSFTNIKGFHSVRLSVRFCALSGFDDDFLVSINDGGMIESATLDGTALDLKSLGYRGAASEALVSKNSITVPSSMVSAQKWQTLEFIISHATESTYLYFCGNTSAAGNHGFLVDEIMVKDLGEDLQRGNLRVLYWNIQNGMWADQANEFENFIEWVKRYDPDVCVWCEAASIYKDNTSVSAPDSERRLPAGWPEIAKKYGHQYAALGGWRDNYPQEITSRYPIETLLKITDGEEAGMPIAHGAAIQQITVSGRKINIVTLHTWPQAYKYGVTGTANREESAKKNEGDYYREYEMRYILDHTVNASEYASCTDWLVMGDFNSKNYSDDWYYKLGESSTQYLCQNMIRNNSSLVDIIGTRYPGKMVSSTAGYSRIDYMYASPSMDARVKNAVFVMDGYAIPLKDSKYGTSFYEPSDHRPILVDFEL